MRRFFILQARSPTALQPPFAVALGWSIWKSGYRGEEDENYRAICDKLFGAGQSFPRAHGDEAEKRARYASTLDLYLETFSKQPPADIWCQPVDYSNSLLPRNFCFVLSSSAEDVCCGGGEKEVIGVYQSEQVAKIALRKELNLRFEDGAEEVYRNAFVGERGASKAIRRIYAGERGAEALFKLDDEKTCDLWSEDWTGYGNGSVNVAEEYGNCAGGTVHHTFSSNCERLPSVAR